MKILFASDMSFNYFEGVPADEKIARVTAIYNDINIAAITKQRMADIYDEARTYFNAINLPAEQKQPLWDFAETLLGRKN
jgi:geranylgeranyl diphosphate synthase type II